MIFRSITIDRLGSVLKNSPLLFLDAQCAEPSLLFQIFKKCRKRELVQILKRSKTVLDLKLTHLHRYDGKLLLGYKSERETDLLESDQTSEA